MSGTPDLEIQCAKDSRQCKREIMAKKLYVGNLSYDTTSESLRAAFEAVGQVATADVISDRYSGRSRGFGFVEMASDADANKAVEQLNGTSLDGRSITVAEARPRENRDDRGGSGGGGRSSGGGDRGGRSNDWGGGRSNDRW